MTRVFATLAVFGAAAFLATACVEDKDYITDLGPDVPACTVTASTDAKDACVRFRDALCGQSVACDLYAGMPACVTWFTSTYGDCEKAGDKPALTEAQNTSFTACLCALPTSSCRSLELSGVESAIPACGLF